MEPLNLHQSPFSKNKRSLKLQVRNSNDIITSHYHFACICDVTNLAMRELFPLFSNITASLLKIYNLKFFTESTCEKTSDKNI